MIAFSQNDLRTARPALEEGERRLRALGDSWGLAWALIYLAQLSAPTTEGTATHTLLEESLAFARDSGDLWMVGVSLYHLGLLAFQQTEYSAAQVWLEEARERQRAAGDRWCEGIVLNLLGNVVLCIGDHERAAQLLTEAIALQRTMDDQHGIATSLHDLGQVALCTGNDEQAVRLFCQSLHLCRDRGYQDGLARCFIGLAEAAARRWPERASELLGSVDTLLYSLGQPLSSAERRNYDRATAAVRAQMRSAPFAAALARGRRMSREQAIALGLQDLQRAGSKPAPAPSPALTTPALQLHDSPETLTAREVEVLRLIATGLSNKELAARLTLSLGTVQNYLHSIYGKLGVTSRSAATRYAWEHHMLARDAHSVTRAEQRTA